MHYQTQGGLLVPTADLAARRGPLFEELAPLTGGRDITRGIVDDYPLLAYQDPLAGRDGGFPLDVYRAVLDDFQVMSALQQRRLGVIATEWEVLPGGTARRDRLAAEHVKAILDALPWDQITDKMHMGVFFGHAVAELLWARDGARIVPEAIRVRDARRFAYTPTAELRLLTVGNTLGEPLPPQKFWTFCTGAVHDDDPYGMGLAHWCYWPTQFKRGTAKLWLIALDKYASPTALGHFPPSASQAERDKLLAALDAIRSQSALILPEGMTAELLAAARTGAADYRSSAEYWDAAISKIILGHSAGADATPGRLGGEDNGMAVRGDLIKADADVLCGSANASWVAWVTEWSYPGAAPPKIWRRTEDDEDLGERAERDARLFTVGYRPTLTQVIETYGGDWERVAGGDPPASTAPDPTATDADATVPPPGDAPPAQTDGTPDTAATDLAAPLATDGQDLIDAELARDASREQQAAMERLLAPILDALGEGLTAEEIMARMDEWYGALDDSLLQELLARGIAAADAIGRLEVSDESR